MSSALVVGAGIGGLAAGRVLREAGFEVRILERAPSLEPLGAGISLWPNAVRVLRELGIDESLPKAAELRDNSGLRRWDGRRLAPTDPAAIERRYGAPMLLLQRATLHRALLRGGVEELVETDAEVVQVVESAGKARAELRNGEKLEADILIGADGIRSKVRAALLNDGPPRPSSLLAYRAIIDFPKLELGPSEFWGPGRVFGLVPVDGDRLYWFATKRGSDEPPEPDPIPGLLNRHRDWAPPIAEVIEATEPQSVLRHDLLDRKPTRTWVGKHVALLGDAAHPMLPFLGQGACQALEDALALGQAFRDSADIPTALRAYETQRRQRAARVVIASRRMGRLAHMRSSPVRAIRDRAMAMVPERARIRQLDPIIGKP